MLLTLSIGWPVCWTRCSPCLTCQVPSPPRGPELGGGRHAAQRAPGPIPGPTPPAAFLAEGRAFRYGIVGSYGTSLYCGSLMFAGVSRMPGGETLRTIFDEWPVSASIAYCTAVTPTL